jgi:uncharacterized protein
MSDEPAAPAVPPGPDKVYTDALANGEFIVQRCAACQTHVFYPRYLCPECGSSRLEWMKASGRGTVYATTIVRQRPEAGGDKNLCVVELAEGPRLLSRVEGTPAAEVSIGMAVAAEIAGSGDEPRYIVFRKA